MRIKRTIKRRTHGKYRGLPLVLIVPPDCDVIYVRQAYQREPYEIDLATVFDLAARKAAIAKKQRGKA